MSILTTTFYNIWILLQVSQVKINGFISKCINNTFVSVKTRPEKFRSVDDENV